MEFGSLDVGEDGEHKWHRFCRDILNTCDTLEYLLTEYNISASTLLSVISFMYGLVKPRSNSLAHISDQLQ